MNLSDKHDSKRPISASPLFKGSEGNVTSLQILKDQQLKEHTTKVPALLICVTGEVLFEDENGLQKKLSSGDFMPIEPMIKHWVNGLQDSQLLLMK